MQWRVDETRIGQSLFCPAEWAKISEPLGLTQRESEVVLAILDMGSYSEIGEEMGVSSNTVHKHLGNVYRKVGVTGRVQLVIRIFWEYRVLASKTDCIVADNCPYR